MNQRLEALNGGVDLTFAVAQSLIPLAIVLYCAAGQMPVPDTFACDAQHMQQTQLTFFELALDPNHIGDVLG